jgi:hypothetical protein
MRMTKSMLGVAAYSIAVFGGILIGMNPTNALMIAAALFFLYFFALAYRLHSEFGGSVVRNIVPASFPVVLFVLFPFFCPADLVQKYHIVALVVFPLLCWAFFIRYRLWDPE